MGERPQAVRGFDPDVPSIARMYDYYLGGKDNYEADRRRAEEAIEADPTLLTTINGNRSFLQRAVRYMASQGIDQFLQRNDSHLGAVLYRTVQAVEPVAAAS